MLSARGKIRRIIFLAGRKLAWLSIIAGCVWGQSVLFVESFSTPGTKLDTTKWTTETGPSSFLGRTQLADWITPGGVGQFVVSADGGHLALNTFNPTGLSLYGTHAKTLRSFQPGPNGTVTLSARVKLTSLQRGIVYGLYFYGCSNAASCASQHDEIDIELVTNYLQLGGPLAVQLNSYANEPLGAGNGKVVSVPSGFDPLSTHDWTIRWSLQEIDCLVDGVLLSSTSSHVPSGPMQVNVIAWGPASDWPGAFDASLQPTTHPEQNRTFTALLSALTVMDDSTSNPSITEYSTPTKGTYLEGITTGPDGALWFAESAVGKIARITTSGTINEYDLPSGGRPITITAGPDGALWFAGTCIGRITTGGVVTDYPVCGTYGIATGPDGALWFTEDSDNKVGRITTSGIVTEYVVPTANSDPSDIVAGPDGAMWFVENFGNKIGRITMQGDITEFAVPRVGIGGITNGPDGALWFTSKYGNYIERITTAGVITEFPTSSGTSDLWNITTGPDGALWFTEDGNTIWRMTTTGISTPYRVPTADSNPVFIAGGPDGAIWFTENAADKVGRLALNATTTPGPAITKVQNSASFAFGPISPGELVYLEGTNLGPDQLVQLFVDSQGMVSTKLDDTEVLFDGQAAPLIYVSTTKIVAIVPYEAAGRQQTLIQVRHAGLVSNTITQSVASTAPGIFTTNASGAGQAAAVNVKPNGFSYNGPVCPSDAAPGTCSTEPAPVGGVVAIYGTGEGLVSPQPATGSVTAGTPPFPTIVAPVIVKLGGVPLDPADVLYSGPAPTLAAGLVQINFRIASWAVPGVTAVQIVVGNNPSNLATIVVGPTE
jgi:virginiamycin B lyase